MEQKASRFHKLAAWGTFSLFTSLIPPCHLRSELVCGLIPREEELAGPDSLAWGSIWTGTEGGTGDFGGELEGEGPGDTFIIEMHLHFTSFWGESRELRGFLYLRACKYFMRSSPRKSG